MVWLFVCLFVASRHIISCDVRTTYMSCTAEVPPRYTADAILLGLLRAVDGHKQARVRQAVLEYGSAHIGVGRPAGCPTPNTALVRSVCARVCMRLVLSWAWMDGWKDYTTWMA
jgi:hypothetical protein